MPNKVTKTMPAAREGRYLNGEVVAVASPIHATQWSLGNLVDM